MTNEPASDEYEVARFQRGDPAGFDALVLKHGGWATRFAVRMLGQFDAAEDAVQEAFVRVYKALAGFRGQASFRTYLYRVVLNCCRDARSRLARDEAALEGLAADVAEASPVEEPSGPLARRELRARIDRFMAALPRAQRETLVLRVHEGLSYREIADVLGVSVNAVKGNLAAARAGLARTSLAREIAAERTSPAEKESES